MATNRRQNVLVSLVLVLALKLVFNSILMRMQAAQHLNDLSILLMVFLSEEDDLRPRIRTLWRHNRQQGFLQNQLLGGYTENMFQDRLRVNKQTFFFLCQFLEPYIQKKNTQMTRSIDVETRVAVTLARLATGNTLSMIGDLYGTAESTVSVIVRECCKAIKDHLLPIVIEKLTSENMKRRATEFESLQGIPYIIGAIDGSHIPIVASSKDSPEYYNRKGFYSVLLQGVVDAQCKFWDFDFGWAGSCHDWAVFQRSQLGKDVMNNKFLPYKLIGDAAYPMRPWFFSPFKGVQEGLSREKAHWNFIQSSTRMAVERAFGCLKGRWRILLKRIDVPLVNIPDLVSACICLHNLCIIHGDGFNMRWAQEAHTDLRNSTNQNFGNLQNAQHDASTLLIARESMKQMQIMLLPPQEAHESELLKYDGDDPESIKDKMQVDSVESKKNKEELIQKMLKQATTQHELMAQNCWQLHVAKESTIIFDDSLDEDLESE